MERARGDVKPIHRWLESNLHQVTVEPPPDEVLADIAKEDIGKIEAYLAQIEDIREANWTFTVDEFSGRVHTNLTYLKSELREYLRVNGKPLCQIDIKCSQPLFIGLLAKVAGYADERYIELCQGDLYGWIAEEMSLDRKVVKEQFSQRGLFSSNRSRHQKSQVMLFIKNEFPLIYEYIRITKAGKKTKANPKAHNVLAKMAQESEVKFIMTACKRIKKQFPFMWVNTIHDSIVVLPENAEHVRLVLVDEFRKIDLKPRLEIELYVREDQS